MGFFTSKIRKLRLEYALREIERNGLTVAKIVEVSGTQYIVAKNGSLHKIGRKPAQTL